MRHTPCGEGIKKLEKAPPACDDSKMTPEVIDAYRSLIGALLWIANVSRPDVSYAVSTLSRKLPRSLNLHTYALVH